MDTPGIDPLMVQAEEEEKDRRPLFLIILVALLGMLCLMVGFQIRSIMRGTQYTAAPVEYPVHSYLIADYQPAPMGTKVPAVKVTIIREMLQDIYFYEDKFGSEQSNNATTLINDAFKSVSEVFQNSVPTATPYLTLTTGEVSATPAVASPTPPATQSPTEETQPTVVVPTIEEPTPTALPTQPPYVPPTTEPPTTVPPTTVPPTNTPTSTPTATLTPIPTNTPTPTYTPTPVPLTVLVSLTPNSSEVNEPGGNITYQVQVTNTYVESVAVLSIMDSVLGDLNGVGTCNTPANPYPAALGAGDTYICYFNLNFFGNPGDSYANQVTAEVEDSLSRTVTGDDNALVTIMDVLPSLTVTKTAGFTSVAAPGVNVIFSVKVANTSIEALTLTHLVDDIFGDLNGKGTCATGGVIAASAEYSCGFTEFVGGTVGSTHTNTITAQVQDDEANAVAGTGSASISIVAPTPSEISGQVRLDVDADGNLADSDAGLQGVSIELRDGVCTPGVDCPVQTSAANGSYVFSGVYSGWYSLVSSVPANYYPTNDSAPPNDSQIPVALSDGVNNTGNDFLLAACGAPNGSNGFVLSTDPASGANVSYTTTQVRVQFDQLMLQSGVGSVLDISNFNGGIENLTYGGVVPFTAISYDDSTHIVTLTLDTSDADWLPGSTYRIAALSSLQNRCGTSQGVDVYRTFTTMSAIGGQVRFDLDADGDLSDPDPGLPFVTIELEGNGCTLGVNCPTMTTNWFGHYLFTDLAPGNYAIYEYDLPGFYSTNDYNGFNFNRIPVNNLGASQYVTGRDFLDAITCGSPDPVNGFVKSTSPADGQNGVPLSPATMTVEFKEPMRTSGTGGAGNPTNFSLWNVTQGSSVTINSVIYDQGSLTTVLGINTSSWWAPGEEYILTIGSGVQNRCGTPQGVNVGINFVTAP